MKYFILLIILFISAGSFADYNKREDKLRQIYFYKLFLEKLDSDLINNNKLISSLISRSRDLTDKINILSKLLESNINNSKDIVTKEIDFLKRKENIDNLKEEYRKRVLWLYKKGPEYQYQLLFLSQSPLNFYSRLEYLTKLSQSRKNEFEKIKYEEYNFAEQKKLQTINRSQVKSYLQQKKEDRELLLKEKLDIEDSLKELKDKNENIQRQISRFKDQISNMESILSEYTSNFIYRTTENIDYANLEFEKSIGRFILPVNSIDILADFGKSVSSATGIVFANNGIDVSIAENSDVRCIHNGIVEEILETPYYGYTVIIKHDNNYRTIYSVLKDIKFIKGSNVKAGDVIAKTSKTLENQMFHFEIRKGFSSIDPKTIFRRGKADFQN